MRKTKISWLLERISEQKKWIDRCGGDLSGYIRHYGDPGIPPCDESGAYATFIVPTGDLDLFRDREFKLVPGCTNTFYKPMYGSGGTAIWEADYARLKSWEEELEQAQAKQARKARA